MPQGKARGRIMGEYPPYKYSGIKYPGCTVCREGWGWGCPRGRPGEESRENTHHICTQSPLKVKAYTFSGRVSDPWLAEQQEEADRKPPNFHYQLQGR